MVAGLVVLIVLTRRHPERTTETARVHRDEPARTGTSQIGAAHP